MFSRRETCFNDQVIYLCLMKMDGSILLIELVTHTDGKVKMLPLAKSEITSLIWVVSLTQQYTDSDWRLMMDKLAVRLFSCRKESM